MGNIIQVGNLWLVKVPKGAKEIFIEFNRVFFIGPSIEIQNEELPPGPWLLIGLASEVGEGVATGLVQLWATNLPFYRNYNWLNTKENYYDTALASLHSLLASHALDPETTLIIKIKEI